MPPGARNAVQANEPQESGPAGANRTGTGHRPRRAIGTRSCKVIPTCRHAATVPTSDCTSCQYLASTSSCRSRAARVRPGLAVPLGFDDIPRIGDCSPEKGTRWLAARFWWRPDAYVS